MTGAVSGAADTVGAVQPRITSVNVVHALIPDLRGDLEKTAIDKRPVDVRVPVQAASEGEVGRSEEHTLNSSHRMPSRMPSSA